MSCTVAHGLRPRYVYYRRQEATTVEPIAVDVETEAHTIVAESINPETENNQAAEKETDHPVVTTEAPEKETDTPKEKEAESPTEKIAESQEKESTTEIPSPHKFAAVDTANQTIYHNVQKEDTIGPQNEETETAAPVEIQTGPTIASNQAEPELESKPTEEAPTEEAPIEEAPENEAVEQNEDAEPELNEQDPERETQNDQEQEQNDQVARAQIDNEQSIVAQQDPNESEPTKLSDPIDQKDTDISMKIVDHTNDNQVNDDEVKSIVSKYFNSVPDIKSQYVLNEGLAKSITHYFKNKVVALPLFHINMKIDRNLVKIPWETGQPLESKKKKSYPYRVLHGLEKTNPGYETK